MRILGIDPGSNYLGLGCVEGKGNSLRWVGHRVAHVSKGCEDNLSKRIHNISLAVREAIETWRPQEVAIEEVFFAKNPKSALKLGQARGAALVPVAVSGLLIFEYSATIIKQTVTGSGRAEKEQVERMVRALLGGGGAGAASLEFQRADASDALAIAICHFQHGFRRAIAPSPAKRLSSPASKDK